MKSGEWDTISYFLKHADSKKVGPEVVRPNLDRFTGGQRGCLFGKRQFLTFFVWALITQSVS